MKNLILIASLLFALLLSSCEFSYLELDESSDHGPCPAIEYVSSLDIIADEKAALQRNWEKDNHMYFKKPMEHEGNVIYYDRDLHSVNLSTGMTNWTLDLGYIASFEQSIKVDDALYLSDDNTIYGIDLNSGELILEYKWGGHENLHRQILMHEGTMYVSVNDCDYEYSAFAFCPMNDIRAGQWTYFNRRVADESESGYTSIKSKMIVRNSKRQDILVSLIAEGSIYEPGRKPKALEAFNIHTNEIDWRVEDGLADDVESNFINYKNQLVVRGDGFVFGLDLETGAELWKDKINEVFYALSSQRSIFLHENILILINRENETKAYNLDNNGAEIWQATSAVDYEQYDEGIENSTFNIVENKVYFLTSWGFLVDIDLATGEYTRHHKKLPFDSGLFVTKDKACISIPQYDRQLVSFNLE